jgi:hypothetical protein
MQTHFMILYILSQILAHFIILFQLLFFILDYMPRSWNQFITGLVYVNLVILQIMVNAKFDMTYFNQEEDEDGVEVESSVFKVKYMQRL